jgi:hypothetical protein
VGVAEPVGVFVGVEVSAGGLGLEGVEGLLPQASGITANTKIAAKK